MSATLSLENATQAVHTSRKERVVTFRLGPGHSPMKADLFRTFKIGMSIVCAEHNRTGTVENSPMFAGDETVRTVVDSRPNIHSILLLPHLAIQGKLQEESHHLLSNLIGIWDQQD